MLPVAAFIALLCQRATFHGLSRSSCCPAEAFLLGRVKKEPKSFTSSPLNLWVEQQTAIPLISIGPHSDAILDRSSLDDIILGWLRDLIGNVHTSCWKKTLVTPEWGLKSNQASLLAAALLKNLQGPSVPAGKKFWVAFRIILKCLGALTLLLTLLFILKVAWVAPCGALRDVTSIERV
ncbi:hypothetical protein J3R82DRAFT_5275 [Butyriboletus roseoflavus]|nr:hypothetical protein J3R82DRAFT_5275 [Butyriboletus roseoflavus]